jgi:hypothetical protein
MTNAEIIARAHVDSAFRTALLKELLRIAVAEDPNILTKALLKLGYK